MWDEQSERSRSREESEVGVHARRARSNDKFYRKAAYSARFVADETDKAKGPALRSKQALLSFIASLV